MYAATRAKYTDIQTPSVCMEYTEASRLHVTSSYTFVLLYLRNFVDGAVIVDDESNLSTRKSLDNNTWNFSSYCQVIRNLMARNHL